MPEKLKDIYRVNEPPITPAEAAKEVDATPTGEGMQIPLAKPITHEKAPQEQYSSMFAGFRAMALAIGVYNYSVPNIPKYWAVFINATSVAGTMVRIESGPLDITITNGGHVVFPGRSPNITITVAAFAADISVFNLGDDKLLF